MVNIMLTIILLFSTAFSLLSSVRAGNIVPCYFVFGDSLVDNGNNNDRNTVAKANFPPYGIDYPAGQTGRFSNGRNVADFIAEALGFANHIPPYATATGASVANGVNYASGGAGILSLTGKQFGAVISLDEQLQNHQTTVQRIISALGNEDGARNHLNQCIYSVGMGSNDYASYTMNPFRPSPDQYASMLIDTYSGQLRDLYSYGARKVAVFGLGTIGCVPAATMRGATYGPLCLSVTKSTSGVFNTKLKSLVDALNKDLVGAMFTYIDTYGITVSDPSSNGFGYPSVPCCTVTGLGMCVGGGSSCGNRTDYAFFDGYHPTEVAAEIVARRAFAALSPSDAYPFDIRHLSTVN